MTSLQKWLLILAIWIFAVGILLHSFQGRYRLTKLYESYAVLHAVSRYDTWTGEVEVKHMKGNRWVWEKGATSWVEELK